MSGRVFARKGALLALETFDNRGKISNFSLIIFLQHEKCIEKTSLY